MKIIERLAMEKLMSDIYNTEQSKDMSPNEIENAFRVHAEFMGIDNDVINDFLIAGDI